MVVSSIVQDYFDILYKAVTLPVLKYEHLSQFYTNIRRFALLAKQLIVTICNKPAPPYKSSVFL